jgi:tRNA-specific 2-thiouridylase
MKNKPKILVAMSGGVDSAVVAALLVKKGFDVTGAFMINFQALPDELCQTSSGGAFTGRSVAETCWTGDYQDALRVAAKLGIKLLKLNFVKEYQETVLKYMYREYEAGRTPNPDVMCNKFVKFGAWLDKAREMGFDKMATGHYAGVREKQGKYFLHTAKDQNKDQTYFLHQLNQDQLSRCLFPLEKYKKDKVKKLAKKWQLPVANKEESMGICFIGEVPMKKFLINKIDQHHGQVVLSGGDAIAEHDGLAFYTIGQRYGLPRQDIKNDKTKALFVVDKNIETNELIVGFDDDPKLYKQTVMLKNVNWISGEMTKVPWRGLVRLRHRQPWQKCRILKVLTTGEMEVKFAKPERAVTPGQFAVFYKRKICLGGGEIV